MQFPIVTSKINWPSKMTAVKYLFCFFFWMNLEFTEVLRLIGVVLYPVPPFVLCMCVHNKYPMWYYLHTTNHFTWNVCYTAFRWCYTEACVFSQTQLLRDTLFVTNINISQTPILLANTVHKKDEQKTNFNSSSQSPLANTLQPHYTSYTLLLTIAHF